MSLFDRDLDDRSEVLDLLSRLRESLPALEDLFHECSSHWGYEDPVYRFYHQSFSKRFDPEHNRRSLEVTRPILEAFFHARYFLEMGIRYAKELQAPPRRLPSGWAAFHYLYGLR